ncbi:MAG: hypothetical protein AAGF12_12845 [Myxococcota bacterium]
MMIPARSILVPCAALLVAGVGCEEEQPPPVYRITFTADADGEPLRGVSITAGNRALGETDRDGELKADLPGLEGQAIPITAQCPEGHRTPESLPMLTLRTFRSLDPAANARGIEVNIDCPPSERQAAVVIRAAGQANLPVLLRGRELTRTDENGVAHVLLTLEPNSSFRLELDTTSVPDLQPQSPGASFTLADADQIFLYDQPFQVKQRRRRPRRPRRPRTPAPGPRLPMRL